MQVGQDLMCMHVYAGARSQDLMSIGHLVALEMLHVVAVGLKPLMTKYGQFHIFFSQIYTNGQGTVTGFTVYKSIKKSRSISLWGIFRPPQLEE